MFPSGLPGLPTLDESEIVQCGTAAAGVRACTREGELRGIEQTASYLAFVATLGVTC
jgi:hypothetical protein